MTKFIVLDYNDYTDLQAEKERLQEENERLKDDYEKLRLRNTLIEIFYKAKIDEECRRARMKK